MIPKNLGKHLRKRRSWDDELEGLYSHILNLEWGHGGDVWEMTDDNNKKIWTVVKIDLNSENLKRIHFVLNKKGYEKIVYGLMKEKLGR